MNVDVNDRVGFLSLVNLRILSGNRTLQLLGFLLRLCNVLLLPFLGQ